MDRARSWVVAGACTLTCLLGAASCSRPEVTAPPEPATYSTEAPPKPEPQWVPTILHAQNPSAPIDALTRHAFHRAHGRQRYTATGGKVEVAESLPAAFIDAYAIDPKGFVFRTLDGSVYRAKTFTGLLSIATDVDSGVFSSRRRPPMVGTAPFVGVSSTTGRVRAVTDGKGNTREDIVELELDSGLGALEEQIVRAHQARFGVLKTVGTIYRLRDGTLVDPTSLTEPRTGRAFPLPNNEPRQYGCAFELAGARAFAICIVRGPHETLLAIHEREAGAWVQRLVIPANRDDIELDEIARAFVAGSAAGFVIETPCSFGDTAALTFCWFHSSEARSVALSHPSSNDSPHLHATLLDLFENWLVYELDDGDGGYWVMDLASQRTRRLGAPESARPRFRGGTLSWLDMRDRRRMLIRWRDGEERAVSLPPGVQHVAFATELQGMAVGRHADAAWTTQDGGDTWKTLEVPIDGDAGSVELGPLECTNVLCRAEPLGVLEPRLFEELHNYEPPRLVGPTKSPAP